MYRRKIFALLGVAVVVLTLIAVVITATPVMAGTPTTTLVTSSGSPSTYGDNVTIIATISDASATGTVEFYDDAIFLGSNSTIDAGGTSTFTVSNLTVGAHSNITANYSGDGTYDASSGTLAGGQTVNQASSTTIVTTSGSPSTYGANVTFTANVTSAGGDPSGTVEFFDGATLLGANSSFVNGNVTFRTSSLTAGAHSNISANYSGDTNFSASNDSLSQTVNQKTMTVTAIGPSVKIYGTALSAGLSTTNFTAVGNISGEDVTGVTLTPNAAGLSATTAAGTTYNVTPSLATGTGGFDADNYDITYTAYEGTVDQKAMTVTATGPSVKIYGTALSAGLSTTNFTAVGNISGEDVTRVTLTPNAAGLSATTAAGATYNVTPSLATGTGGFDADNYDITYTAYEGIVDRKALTVTADNKGKVYGAALPTFTATATGLVGTDNLSSLILGYTLNTTATAASPAGTYPITITGGATNTTNYGPIITYVNGTLTVVAASGGSGGSGSGGPKATPTPTPTPTSNTTSLSGKVNSAGNFTANVTAFSRDGNASVTIHAGVAGHNASGGRLTQITITTMSTPPAPPVDANAVGLYYDFGPSGANFSSPITITLKYNPNVADPSKLYIAWWNASAGQWVQLATTVNTTNHTLTATITHFTTFAILAPVPPTPTPTPTPAPTPTPTPAPSGGLSTGAWAGIGVAVVIVLIILIYLILLKVYPPSKRRHEE